MKKNTLLVTAILSMGLFQAQIQVNNGINSGIASSNVLLDGSTYFSTESGAQPNAGKGIVVPSVDLTLFEFDLTLADGVTFPTYFDGMIVYNSATGNTLTTGNRPSASRAVVPGFYYFSNPSGASNGNVTGGAWKPLGEASAVTSSNGLTLSSGDVKLGGPLTQATTISGLSPTNTLNISGGPLRVLNGGVSNATTGNEQLLMALSGTQTYKHAIKTRHNDLGPRGNSFDFYTWKSGTDALTDIGTQHVMTLDGNGFVGIGNLIPASTLDINAKIATGTSSAVDGLLIPRVDRQRAASMTSVPTSTMIYINSISTGAQSGTAANIDAIGFYYFDGTVWQKMVQPASSANASNGLTLSSGDVKLGGPLTQATTISGLSPTNTLNVSGGPLRVLNGGPSNATSGNEQLLMAFSGTQNYKHAIKTRHNDLGPRGNSFDFYTWKSGTDALTDIGTQHVMTLDGNGFVGIGNLNPASTLDINAKIATGTSSAVDGLLIPRVDRQRAASMTSVPTSTMIYVNSISTGAQSGTAANINAIGFYYFDGTAWQKMVQPASSVTASNGLTLSSGDAKLGGPLTQATTISGLSATNTLNVSGGPLRILNGGVSNATTGNEQLLMALSGTQTYKHAIKTRHNDLGPRGNSFDFYTWKSGTDALTDTGTQHVMTLDGNGFVGIGNLIPASTLDINAKIATGTSTAVDGLLIPRVDRQRAANMASVPTSTMIYINSVSTGAQSGIAANINAVGFYYFDGAVWQKVMQPYQNVRGNVNKLPSSTSTYTVQSTDFNIISSNTGSTAITFPALTAADAGRIVYISNLLGSGAVSYVGIDSAYTAPASTAGGTNAFIWTGTSWGVLSRQ